MKNKLIFSAFPANSPINGLPIHWPNEAKAITQPYSVSLIEGSSWIRTNCVKVCNQAGFCKINPYPSPFPDCSRFSTIFPFPCQTRKKCAHSRSSSFQKDWNHAQAWIQWWTKVLESAYVFYHSRNASFIEQFGWNWKNCSYSTTFSNMENFERIMTAWKLRYH